MTCRLFRCSLGLALLLLAMFAGPQTAAADETEEGASVLKLMATTSDINAMMMAVGVSSLANLKVDEFDIETIWQGPEASFQDAVAQSGGQLHLIDLARIDASPLEIPPELRMVMRLWRSLPAQDQGPEAVDSGHALVADKAAPAEAIQALIEAIQADQRILKAAHIDMARLDPSISMSDPPIALHAGAEAYLSSNGILLAAPPSDEQENLVEPEAEAILEEQPLIVDATELGGRSFTIFFETDEAKLDREDYVSVAEACRYAATLPTARFIISGHADTVGPETYNTQLSRRRAESAAGAIENDPRFREALSVMEYGESMLAVTTEDGVDEPKNRRVEITVVQNE